MLENKINLSKESLEMSNRETANIMTDEEAQGILAIKEMNQKYLKCGKGSEAVLDYLTKAGEDDVLLLRFLRGRKHRPKHAWDTVRITNYFDETYFHCQIISSDPFYMSF